MHRWPGLFLWVIPFDLNLGIRLSQALPFGTARAGNAGLQLLAHASKSEHGAGDDPDKSIARARVWSTAETHETGHSTFATRVSQRSGLPSERMEAAEHHVPLVSRSIGQLPSDPDLPDFRADIWFGVSSASKCGNHFSVIDAWRSSTGEGWHSFAGLSTAFSSGKIIPSASPVDWYFILTVLALFVAMDVSVLQQLPETTRTNAVLLVFWLLLGTAVGAEVWLRKGPQDGSLWITGYILELMFSLDRVFVMVLVFSTLETPRRLMSKALFLAMFGTFATRWFFLSGWAPALASLQVIPLLLGLGLVYCGTRQIALNDEMEDVSDVTRTPVVYALKLFLGNRLAEFYDEESEAVVTIVKGKYSLTLLGVALLSLVATDVLMSLDLALVKQEEVPNGFLDITSAVVAAFAVRSLFFVVRDVVNVFGLEKYGLGIALFFIGSQTLLARTMLVNALASATTIISVLLISVGVSVLHESPKTKTTIS